MSVADALESRIHAGIPLSAAMRFRIVSLQEHAIAVSAPLAPNVNVHGTAFAGSLYAVGILTAWGLAAHLIDRAGLGADLVVAEATIRYRAPVEGDIVSRCSVDPAAAGEFTGRLASDGRARLALTVVLGEPPAATILATMHARLR
ncbi:MAG: YiiD C-terminal domain-containing protein [Gammaproteobacteria bacterium]|nr:YiiD C-terminal domain-containing protein [Gammaproteobacteria bacterium]